jgi:hypothetical protein
LNDQKANTKEEHVPDSTQGIVGKASVVSTSTSSLPVVAPEGSGRMQRDAYNGNNNEDEDDDSFPWGFFQLILVAVFLLGCAQLNCWIERRRSKRFKQLQ